MNNVACFYPAQPIQFPLQGSLVEYDVDARLTEASAYLYRIAAEHFLDADSANGALGLIHEAVFNITSLLSGVTPSGYLSPIARGALAVAGLYHPHAQNFLEHSQKLRKRVLNAITTQHVNLNAARVRRQAAVHSLLQKVQQEHHGVSYIVVRTQYEQSRLATWSQMQKVADRIKQVLEGSVYVLGAFTAMSFTIKHGIHLETVVFTQSDPIGTMRFFDCAADFGVVSVDIGVGWIATADQFELKMIQPIPRKPNSKAKEFAAFEGLALKGGL